MDIERKVEVAKRSLLSIFTHDDAPHEDVHGAWDHLKEWAGEQIDAMKARREAAIAAADAKAKADAAVKPEAATITEAGDAATVVVSRNEGN